MSNEVYDAILDRPELNMSDMTLVEALETLERRISTIERYLEGRTKP